MREARAVISDLDGTLVQTRAANRAAYADAFAAEGVRFDADVYDAAFGLNFHDMMATVAPGLGQAAAERIADSKRRLYPERFPLVEVNTALVALLTTMRSTGVPIALASTARRANVETLLSHLGLASLFDVIVAGEDVGSGKPAPDAYLLAASELQVEPEHCVVFEDSPFGIEAADAAGCLVMKVTL